jgi:3-oxoacyl-[acyl-carrier protein] reductase
LLTLIRLFRSVGDDDETAQKMKKLLSVIPMGRVTEPADVSNAVWYLASDQSSFVTGTILEVRLTLIIVQEYIN